MIQDNIYQKKKQNKIKSNSIKEVLNNMNDNLLEYNPVKITIDKYRKEISDTNNRLSNLIKKENSIFKK